MDKSQLPFVITAGYDLNVTTTPLFKDQAPSKIKSIPCTYSQVNKIAIYENSVALAVNPYILIYDISTANPKPDQYSGHNTNVTDLCFHENLLYSCSEDRTWQVFERNPKNPRPIKTVTASPLNSMELHPSGNTLFTANEKGQVEMWDTKNFKLISAIKLSQLPIRSISLSQDGSKLVSACQDGNVVILAVDSTNLSEIHRFKAHTDIVLSCAIAPDQSTFVTTSADSTAKLWDMNTYELKYTLAEQNQKKWVWDAAYTDDSKHVVTCGTDKAIRTWETQSGNMVFKNESAHSKGIVSLAIFNSKKK